MTTTTTAAADVDASSGSQNSPQPAVQKAVSGGGGSAGKTYNLRRRGKTAVEGPAGAAAAAGRRTGLRDLTNAI